MRRTIETVGAAILVMAGVANAAEAPSAEAASKVAAQFHAALAAGNADGASALLSATALIYESGHAETRDEYISHHLADDIAFAKATQRTVKTTRQQCDESMCLLMQSSETTGSVKGKSVRYVGQETMVLRREGDAWKIQHVHWSSHK
jgi:nucleoid-associated protein YgaU